MNVIVDVTTTPIEVDVTIGSEVAAKFWAEQSELFAQQASDTFDLIVPAVNQGISDINDARDQSIIDVGQAESDAIVAVGQAETDAINNITPLVTETEGYRDEALQAKIDAESARDLAEGFKDDAEAAKIAAEGFADDAEADAIATAADVVTVTDFSNLILASQNTAITQALGSITGTVDIDLILGTLVTATLTDAVTFTFSGLPSTGRETAFTLRLSGLEQITFPVGTKFANGDVPTPEGALYEIPCSIDSTGALIVYGVINDIKVP
jgi:hypothetical protein